MIALTRSLLITWVTVWSTSRQDVALHLVTWIVIGSALAAYFREAWISKLPLLFNAAEEASAEMLDIMPESQRLVHLVSFAICGMTAFFLAGAENKSKGKTPMRGAWLVFAVSRVLFPISACTVDQNSDPVELAMYSIFTVISLVGPLSSWPSRSFAISDAVYALALKRAFGDSTCTGTEAALVAAGLALAHDLVHTRFLNFLESMAFAVATVFIAETTMMVILLRDSPAEENWNDALDVFGTKSIDDYLLRKAPPVLLSAWAVGMFFRTFTQGRVSALELVLSLGMGACFGLAVVATARDPFKVLNKPSFACATLVMAMGCASKLAVSRKRVLKKNKYIVASGFFAPVQSSAAVVQEQEILCLGADEAELSTDSEPDDEAFEVPVRASPSMRQGPTPTAAASALASRPSSEAAPKETHADQLVREFEEEMRSQTLLQKNLFYLEALLKGHPSQKEKDDAKSDIARLKAELEKSRAKADELHKKIVQQEQ